MRKRLTIILLFFSIIFSNTISAQNTFGKLINTDPHRTGLYHPPYIVTKLADNNFLIAGISVCGFYLSKLDSFGNIIWSRNYSPGCGRYISVKSIIALPDSGFICIGEADNCIFLSKHTSFGKALWVKAYSIQDLASLTKAVQGPDGYLYILSESMNGDDNSLGNSIIKFDTLGKVIGQLHIKGQSQNLGYPSDIIINKNNEIVVTGWSFSGYTYIMLINPQLNNITSFSYTSSKASCYPYCIHQLKNGDYILGVTIYQHSGNFLKLDSSFQILTSNSFALNNNPVQFRNVASIDTNNIFLITGGNSTHMQETGFASIIKVDNNGDTINTHSYYGSQPNYYATYSGFYFSNNECPIILMQPNKEIYNGFNSIILKTDSNGDYQCNKAFPKIRVEKDNSFSRNDLILTTWSKSIIETNLTIVDSLLSFTEDEYCLYSSTPDLKYSSDNEIFVFPNPTEDFINIRLNNMKNVSIEIVNLQGKIIYRRNAVNDTTIDLSSWQTGLYLIKITGKDFECTKKVLKK